VSKLTGTCLIAITLVTGHAVAADNAHHEFEARIQTFKLPLDKVNFSDGINYNATLGFTTGIGSGAYHYPGDDRNTVYTISDRGVNVDCKDDLDIIGADICISGKIFPVAKYAPSIFKLQKQGRHGWNLVDVIQLKDASGAQITGLPNPFTSTDTEAAYNKNGLDIGFDVNGLDTEALVRLSDGSFWLSEEYAPSLVHVSATGEVLERLVPAGIEDELDAASYQVTGALPAILSKRKLNRGIESIAVSPDEQSIYFILQSPLANPNATAYKQSRHVRVFKMDLQSKTVVGEYVYVMDTPDTFIEDNSTKQNDVKISEMVAYAEDKLIVLERISKTTRLYRIELEQASNILNTEWDNIVTSPSLEQIADLAAMEIIPVKKEIALDSSLDIPGVLPSKVEGVAILNNSELFLVNDNDFGIDGSDTQLINLKVGKQFFK